MEKKLNTLPIQYYVRTRTIVRDVSQTSSGSIELALDKPSDVTVIVMSDIADYVPCYFVAAIGRTATTMDFDVILSPAVPDNTKPAAYSTLHLPAGNYTLHWATFSNSGAVESFSATGMSRLALAIDA